MRGNQCAINSPRFTATSSRGLFGARATESFSSVEREWAGSTRSPAKPDRFHFAWPTAILFGRELFQFTILPRVPAALLVPLHLGPPFSSFFIRFRTRRKGETPVIYEDASITTAPRDTSCWMLYRPPFDASLSRLSLQSRATNLFWTRLKRYAGVWDSGWLFSDLWLPSKVEARISVISRLRIFMQIHIFLNTKYSITANTIFLIFYIFFHIRCIPCNFVLSLWTYKKSAVKIYKKIFLYIQWVRLTFSGAPKLLATKQDNVTCLNR